MAGDDRDSAESRRILERVSHESDPSSASLPARAANRAQEHFAAADADRSDPIELWGTRIGRTIGLVVTIGLIIWLAFFVLRGG